jgi:subtilisin family serine protease
VLPQVFVVHVAQDEPFVRERLLTPLPALGFGAWLSSGILSRNTDGPSHVAGAMSASDAILAVVSDATVGVPSFQDEAALALRSGSPVIPVYLNAIVPGAADKRLELLPGVKCATGSDSREAFGDRTLWTELADLLPPASWSRPSHEGAEPIRWDETVFSYFLAAAVGRHDYNRGDTLVRAFAAHLNRERHAYPAQSANRDLAALRKKRQFALMRRYATAVLGSGSADLTVRRQYGQSLIELGEFAAAVDVLEQVVRDASPQHEESFEARGLLGRVHKQRYVNAPAAPDASDSLRRAISAYLTAFREDGTHVWHGINAASLLLRAESDRVETQSAEDGREIAGEVLRALDRRQDQQGNARLDVWDYATRVEALVDVEDFERAAAALAEYVAHPDMNAFEVSSTHRQFDEVLQLDRDPRGRPLLDTLWDAVERHRAGGASRRSGNTRGSARDTSDDRSMEGAPARALLVRVSDPAWKPAPDIPDLRLHSRLGTVVSITGSDATVKALLKDPIVIAVEDSRPCQLPECNRSLPFINVQNPYTGAAGPFSEKGDRALVAIVDDGIDVLHRAFADAAGASRIVGIWDQRDKTGPAPTGFDFGTYYTKADVARLVAANPDPAAATFTVPASLGRNTDGHGTHVASIAAGRATAAFAGGVAPEASILVVITAGGERTGYSHAHIAALTFVDQFASALGMPVVVNVSQGMNAGAHDGRSALEVAFDEFSKGGRTPGRVVVKSAGNERDKRGHARVTLMPDSVEELRWTRQMDPLWPQDRLELWWDSANEFRFRLAAPSGECSDWVDGATPDLSGRLKGGGPFRMQFVKRHVDNGDSLLSVDIGSGATLIAAGEWKLQIQSVKVVVEGDIHAWFERGGTAPSEFADHSQDMTLSIPGTANNVITVGAVDASKPIVVGGFSSYGPTRDGRNKPEVVAPGMSVRAARGGTFDDVIVMNGTSMAAPHVTGAVALLLSKTARANQPCPTATQIASALRQKTLNYNGRWDRGQGFGVIDVAALLNAF